MIRQDPEDIDPDQWLDEGELTELPEAPLGKAERRSRQPSVDQEPELEIQVTHEDPEEIAVREGVHKRIQAEIHHEDKEAEAMVEEMLKVPPKWNEVPDLMLEDKDIQPATEGAAKQKIDEVARGQRKRR